MHKRIVLALALIVLGFGVLHLSAQETLGAGALAKEYVVDNNSDDASKNACSAFPDDCSLRGAVNNANIHAETIGIDAITFNIPPAGLNTIVLTSGMLGITDHVLIDGTTQPDAATPQCADTPCVVIDGTGQLDGFFPPVRISGSRTSPSPGSTTPRFTSPPAATTSSLATSSATTTALTRRRATTSASWLVRPLSK